MSEHADTQISVRLYGNKCGWQTYLNEIMVIFTKQNMIVIEEHCDNGNISGLMNLMDIILAL
jgi:hypothetical protein